MKKKYLNIIQHYEQCFELHGDTHRGVDWPDLSDAKKRYGVMLDLIFIKEGHSEKAKIDLLDFGCGASHLYEYILEKNFHNIKYSGLDLSEKFIEVSKKKYPDNEYYCLDILDPHVTIRNFDYIVMNGVFTEKRDLSFDEMLDYFKSMVIKVFDIAHEGIAFNVMSKHVDWERKDLFHLPFDVLTDFLTKKVSRNFIIRNDYGLHEYTTYVYKLPR